MPGSYLIDVERGIVFSRAWGVLTDAEVISHAKTLRADSRFDPGFRQLVDFRGLSAFQLTSDGIKHVARLNPFNQDARRAFVVASDVALGMIRMFQIYTEAEERLGIFHGIEPALEWIGLDPATAWPAQAPDATFGE